MKKSMTFLPVKSQRRIKDSFINTSKQYFIKKKKRKPTRIQYIKRKKRKKMPSKVFFQQSIVSLSFSEIPPWPWTSLHVFLCYLSLLPASGITWASERLSPMAQHKQLCCSCSHGYHHLCYTGSVCSFWCKNKKKQNKIQTKKLVITIYTKSTLFILNLVTIAGDQIVEKWRQVLLSLPWTAHRHSDNPFFSPLIMQDD